MQPGLDREQSCLQSLSRRTYQAGEGAGWIPSSFRLLSQMFSWLCSRPHRHNMCSLFTLSPCRRPQSCSQLWLQLAGRTLSAKQLGDGGHPGRGLCQLQYQVWRPDHCEQILERARHHVRLHVRETPQHNCMQHVGKPLHPHLAHQAASSLRQPGNDRAAEQ